MRTCPFCGCPRTRHGENGTGQDFHCWVECDYCGAQGPVSTDYEVAQARWDSRLFFEHKERNWCKAAEPDTPYG